MTYRDIAAAVTDLGFRTRRNGPWTTPQIYKRLNPRPPAGADDEADVPPASAALLAPWRAAGWTDGDALAWLDAGADGPQEATAWLDMGYGPDDAQPWLDAGFRAGDAAPLIAQGVEPELAADRRAGDAAT